MRGDGEKQRNVPTTSEPLGSHRNKSIQLPPHRKKTASHHCMMLDEVSGRGAGEQPRKVEKQDGSHINFRNMNFSGSFKLYLYIIDFIVP